MYTHTYTRLFIISIW